MNLQILKCIYLNFNNDYIQTFRISYISNACNDSILYLVKCAILRVLTSIFSLPSCTILLYCSHTCLQVQTCSSLLDLIFIFFSIEIRVDLADNTKLQNEQLAQNFDIFQSLFCDFLRIFRHCEVMFCREHKRFFTFHKSVLCYEL